MEHVDAGLDWLMSNQATWTAFPDAVARAGVTGVGGADPRRHHYAADGAGSAGDRREVEPDLVVREGIEHGGCIAAEALGIPDVFQAELLALPGPEEMVRMLESLGPQTPTTATGK